MKFILVALAVLLLVAVAYGQILTTYARPAVVAPGYAGVVPAYGTYGYGVRAAVLG